jgi:hypothetical protein
VNIRAGSKVRRVWFLFTATMAVAWGVVMALGLVAVADGESVSSLVWPGFMVLLWLTLALYANDSLRFHQDRPLGGRAAPREASDTPSDTAA